MIPVKTLDMLFEDDHLAASGFWHRVDHPTEGRLRLCDQPITLSHTPCTIHRLQPRLGIHRVHIRGSRAAPIPGGSVAVVDQMPVAFAAAIHDFLRGRESGGPA